MKGEGEEAEEEKEEEEGRKEEAFATRCAATRESRNTFAEIRFRDGLFLSPTTLLRRRING